MSADHSIHGNEAIDRHGDDEDDGHNWIGHVEHEETIASEAVNEEEVEEYIEVDGVVDDHDMGQTVLLRGDTVVVPGNFRKGVERFYAHVPTGLDTKLNLPDLLSRVIPFTNGSRMYLCFSKRCRKQLAFDGHLYEINGFMKPGNWNYWRCVNPVCKAAVRTSPNITEMRVREPHCTDCIPDDVQIRLRITVYDLRLMAEFTDMPLDALYHAYLDKVVAEHNDIISLFPPFESLKSNLEDHRAYHIYRKRFANEARETDINAWSFDSLPGNAAKFRRTKPFPPSLCMSCSAEFRSTPEIPSQDQLLEHMLFDHGRKSAIVNRFIFEESGLFEQWIRELQYHSKYRMKKMGIHDEYMYYLCQNDDRQFKSNHGRATLIDMHCTAFIRVHDWRLVIRHEVPEVVVDYCLDHFLHSDFADPAEACKPSDELFTPEVFMRDLAARRERTQQLIQDTGLQRVKRRAQPPSLTLNFSPKPNSADVAQGDLVPRLHYIAETEEQGSQDGWGSSSGSVFGASKTLQRQKAVQQIVGNTSSQASNSHSSSKEPSQSAHVTKRSNFLDSETYNSVLQFEMVCDVLKERMQYARNVRTAVHYLNLLTRILDDVMADPQCAPSSGSAFTDSAPSSSVEATEIPAIRSPSTASEDSSQDRKPSSGPLKREAKNEADESLPLRQKVLVRKGENGQLIVVRRTILGKVRKVSRSNEGDPNAEEPTADEASPSKASTSTQAEQILRASITAPQSNTRSRVSNDGPPIGDILRDAFYCSRVPRYDRTLLQGVRQVALQNSTSGAPPYFGEETKRLIRQFSDNFLRKKAPDAPVIRRTPGRPRKYL